MLDLHVQYLDENKWLILKILENQNSGKLSENGELWNEKTKETHFRSILFIHLKDLLVISDQNIPKIRKVTMLTTKQCRFSSNYIRSYSLYLDSEIASFLRQLESFLVGEGARMWAKSKGIPLLASILDVDERGQKDSGIDGELSSSTQENAAVSGNHKNIFNDARVPWSEYRYYDPKTVGLDFDGMISDIKLWVLGLVPALPFHKNMAYASLTFHHQNMASSHRICFHFESGQSLSFENDFRPEWLQSSSSSNPSKSINGGDMVVSKWLLVVLSAASEDGDDDDNNSVTET
ncbi:hypothetical protein TEA_013652 [Camellia sinensis var. sinensis]|uniref:Uncharacterized protein n=1 Tax=Camellia sinensis var. sinensis TaxID=542762 RepID=A0A4V3WLL4_CAMSN|nr:hypothetical protein TEA_013652 [Camellia sinensis var. sinensis]